MTDCREDKYADINKSQLKEILKEIGLPIKISSTAEQLRSQIRNWDALEIISRMAKKAGEERTS